MRYASLVGHEGGVTCLAIAHSCSWAISGGEDSVIRVWNMIDARQRWSSALGTGLSEDRSACVSALAGHTGRITGVAVTPSDRWVLLDVCLGY